MLLSSLHLPFTAYQRNVYSKDEECDVGMIDVEIFNLPGERLYAKNFLQETGRNNEIRISLEKIKAGIYSVRIKTKEGISRAKFVKV